MINEIRLKIKIITVYEPDKELWINKQKRRLKIKYHKPAAERALKVTDPAAAKEVHLLEAGPILGWPPYSQMVKFMDRCDCLQS